MKGMCSYRTACQSGEVPTEGIPGIIHLSVRTQSIHMEICMLSCIAVGSHLYACSQLRFWSLFLPFFIVLSLNFENHSHEPSHWPEEICDLRSQRSPPWLSVPPICRTEGLCICSSHEQPPKAPLILPVSLALLIRCCFLRQDLGI